MLDSNGTCRLTLDDFLQNTQREEFWCSFDSEVKTFCGV